MRKVRRNSLAMSLIESAPTEHLKESVPLPSPPFQLLCARHMARSRVTAYDAIGAVMFDSGKSARRWHEGRSPTDIWGSTPRPVKMAAARRKASPPCPVSVPGDFFASLDGLQLYTFKEMFNFIDLDKDGRISEGKSIGDVSTGIIT